MLFFFSHAFLRSWFDILVSQAQRNNTNPSRTWWLNSTAVTILQGRSCGKIARRQDDKKLNTSHSYYFFNMKKKNEKVVLFKFKTPIMKSPLSHFTPRNAPFLQRERRFHIFLTRNEMAGERKGSFFFQGTPGNRSSGDEVGPVAQRIRARGYEPRCRGFESLLAHNRPKRVSLWGQENHDRDSGPKAMELGRGSFAEMEWPFIYYLSYIYF